MIYYTCIIKRVNQRKREIITLLIVLQVHIIYNGVDQLDTY
jgi:hypothetical protein